MKTLRTAIVAIFIALVSLAPSGASAADSDGVEKIRIETAPGIFLDGSIYKPKVVPAPAILLAHGFGGSKDSVATEAKFLQGRGYLVLTWSARGFGDSTGLISMNSQQAEISDGKKLIDELSRRRDVLKQGGNPVVGITGASYGGANALLSAAADSRIDAVAADITWSNLNEALFPQSAVGESQSGPFKKIWTGTFFALSTLQKAYLGECGALASNWCDTYKSAVLRGAPNAEERALLNSVSPNNFISSLRAPTLLMQGQADSLFPLAQSLENLAILKKSIERKKLALIWHASGHDGGGNEDAYLWGQSADWFDKFLRGEKKSFPTFQYVKTNGGISLQDSTVIPKTFQSNSFPGENSPLNINVATTPAVIAYPVGGIPSAITALPGVGGAGALASTIASGIAGFSPAFIPGQSGFIDGPVLTKPVSIVGRPSIKVRVTSTSGEATLFFSVVTRGPSGSINQPNGIVAPVHLTSIPKTGRDVEIKLPAIILDAASGDKISLGISSTDQGYELPKQSSFITVAALSPLTLPTLESKPAIYGASLFIWPTLALLVLVAAVVILYLRRRKDSEATHSEETLVKIDSLSKIYKDGYQAVSNLSFEVKRGQVLGLLGPNGAGKTTTLRMLMGLIFPTEGHIYLQGREVYPGSPALANLGSFVEGSGFLPHLSGRENLDLYWKSIGRDGENYLDEALQIANLGTALDKKVRSYSQGMRQRLAIAQAMLGMPDLLVLDEPTNGLDPQQIVEMRDVLKKYAKTGRTVIISSHLLSEIQQTCTDVVLMHRGKLVAFGPMKKILTKNRQSRSLEEIFLELIGDDLVIGKDAQ